MILESIHCPLYTLVNIFTYFKTFLYTMNLLPVVVAKIHLCLISLLGFLKSKRDKKKENKKKKKRDKDENL